MMAKHWKLAATAVLGLMTAEGLAQTGGPSLRTYDVRALLRKHAQAPPRVMGLHPEEPASVETAARAVFELPELATCVTQLSGVDSAAQHFRASIEEGGFLRFAGVDVDHARVERFLDQLQQILLRQYEVEVHVLPGTALEARRALLSPAEVEALFRSHPNRRVHRGRGVFEDQVRLGSMEARPVVSAVDMQVSEGAGLPDPEIGELRLGCEWTVSVHPAHDGRMLMRLRGSDASPVPERMISVPSSTDAARPEEVDLALPAASGGRWHVDAMVHDGQGVLVGTSGVTDTALCVVVRCASAMQFAADSGLHCIAVGELVAPGSDRRCHVLRTSGRLSLPDETDEAEHHPTIDGPRLLDLLKLQDDAAGRSDLPLNFVGSQKALVLFRAPEKRAKEVRDVVQSFGALVAHQWSLEVRYGLVDANSVPFVRDAVETLATTVLDRQCLCIVGDRRPFGCDRGVEAAIVTDYEPKVAPSVALARPIIGKIWQGVVVTAGATRLSSSRVRLDLGWQWSRIGDPVASIDLGDPRLGRIDQPTRVTNEVVAAPTVEVGTWTLVHLAPVVGKTEHAAVAVRLTEM